MWEFIKRKMIENPNSEIFDIHRRYSYCQFLKHVEMHGKKLSTLLPEHAKCAVLCDHGLNTAIAVCACWAAGLVAVPLSKNYGEKHYNSIIQKAEPSAIICDSNTEELASVVYNISAASFEGIAEESQTEPELTEISLLMATSGTTGAPKVSMITTSGLQNNVEGIVHYFPLNNSDTVLISRPLYHCAVLTGEFLASLYQGANICFLDQIFRPSSILDCIDKYSITVLCGTPTLFTHICRCYERFPCKNNIRMIAISGECLSKESALKIRNVFMDAQIFHVYGLTEASPRVSYLPPDKFDVLPNSVGVALPNTTIKILDSNEQPCLPNQAGTVFVHSLSLMKGYYKDEIATKHAFSNGWLNTGDIGCMDDHGYLYILSRADDMIIKGGMNIYPQEIEGMLSDLPEIKECMAYGIHYDTGQTIGMDVVVSDIAKHLTKKELLCLFHKVLPDYLLPSQLNIVDAFEHNASGKRFRKRRIDFAEHK